MKADLVIVGAGPAGIAAAVEACAHRLSVLVLDENRTAGGRIWESLERRAARSADDPRPFTNDDARALQLVTRFKASGADIRQGATVWAIQPGGQVLWSDAGAAHSVTAAHILLATGTTERPMPVPGWTRPGVMTVGAAQILLKSGGLVPDGEVWLAGQGPLLLLYAVQVIEAGGRLAGVLDLSAGTLAQALPALPRALRAPSYLAKGIRWRLALRRAKVPWIRATEVAAQGERRLASVTFTADGKVQTHAADLLLLHDGVIPSVHITRALGVAHDWDAAAQCWVPQVDGWGVTSDPIVSVAGDGAGIGGVEAAVLSGRIAALGIAQSLGRISIAARDAAAAPLHTVRARHLAVRPLLHALFPPLHPRLADETIVCRCEEVTAGDLRQAVAFGCLGPNQAKAFTRCGMGPCQSRMCGPTAAAVIAEARGVPVAEIEPMRLRFPTRPVFLEDVAQLRIELEEEAPKVPAGAGGH